MATTEDLADFSSLLAAARQQDEPQQLLFVFARKQLDHHASTEQRRRFERDEGGYLKPCLCVDKAPDEIPDFDALSRESEQTGQHWDVLFAGSLSGHAGKAVEQDEIDRTLRYMVNAINKGRVGEFAVFNRDGDALALT